MARHDDRLATMVPTVMFLEKTSAGAGQQEHQAEQLFHPNLAVKDRPSTITA
jgi:hypothetical protein